MSPEERRMRALIAFEILEDVFTDIVAENQTNEDAPVREQVVVQFLRDTQDGYIAYYGRTVRYFMQRMYRRGKIHKRGLETDSDGSWDIWLPSLSL